MEEKGMSENKQYENALQTLLKSRQKTESCMFRRFLTAMT